MSGKAECGSRLSALPRFRFRDCSVGSSGVGGLPGSPSGLRLTIRCGKRLRSVQARSAGPILPPCRLCQNMQPDPASSHVLKTYSGLVFTVLRRDVMRNRRAPPAPPEEPPCLHQGSLRPRPQALETLCSGLQLRESCQGMCLSFRS